jgi:hypothetical protein
MSCVTETFLKVLKYTGVSKLKQLRAVTPGKIELKEMNFMYRSNILIVDRLLKTASKAALLMVAALMFSGSLAFAAPPETMPIWRAQVRFVTANVEDSGSDDDVKVGLNFANNTWIDSDLDDFETGIRTYDLRLEGVNRLSDIDFFRLEKTGSDGWAIQQVSLIINGVTLYRENFSPALWLDNDNGNSRVFFMDDTFMRPRIQWLNYVVPVRPNIVPVNDMRLRIESILGDFVTTDGRLMMQRLDAHGTELFTLNANTWRVDLDLESDDTFWNVDIDVDFDLTIGCLNGRPDFTVSNVNAYSNPDRWATDRARNFINGDFRFRLNDMMKNFSFLRCNFVGIVLASNGDLHFSPTFTLPGGGGVITGGGGIITAGRTGTLLDDNSAPLGIFVTTEDRITAFSETSVKTNLKSGLTEDSEVNVSFELSPQMALPDNVVEAKDSETTRRIAAEIVRREDGSSLVVFRDRIAAGKNTEYTLRVIFQPGEDQAERIVTRVEPLTPTVAAKITPLRAVTHFRSGSGEIISEGTSIQNSGDIVSDEQRRLNLKAN